VNGEITRATRDGEGLYWTNLKDGKTVSAGVRCQRIVGWAKIGGDQIVIGLGRKDLAGGARTKGLLGKSKKETRKWAL